MNNVGWHGVDLDGTLAEYHGWKGHTHIGKPVDVMVARVKAWLAAGEMVKIFTARANDFEAIEPIQQWCFQNIGIVLPITATKDYAMIDLWDDRCVQVEPNTGKRIDGK